MRYVNGKYIRTLLILVAGFIIFASADFTAAQATKSNDDRKAECRNNLHGNVVNYTDGGFACVAGTSEATIFCTSSGQCACFGEDCGELGGGGALGRLADGRKTIIAGFPKNLTKQQKSAKRKAMDESLAALRKGDGKTAVKKIEEFSALMDNGGSNPADGIECRDRCQHHLDDGNAPAYAVCWWSCWIGASRTDKITTVSKPPVVKPN